MLKIKVLSESVCFIFLSQQSVLKWKSRNNNMLRHGLFTFGFSFTAEGNGTRLKKGKKKKGKENKLLDFPNCKFPTKQTCVRSISRNWHLSIEINIREHHFVSCFLLASSCIIQVNHYGINLPIFLPNMVENNKCLSKEKSYQRWC